ncbi:hypothetical protein DFR70_101331 [Nocardia tenerifensis]|uniref:Uncharacterized protein n=1 Tax=Nocardia tenerifensis TaxID=228006 RepID=A0A318KMK5_9NOCA|nr:hypothetical protein [Nocardia tenerifensis]PXX70910.1 hypothetical protein DFR70_101331 [Nocardia tenerifensis]
MLAPDKERQELESALRQHVNRVNRIKDKIRDLNNELGVHTVLLSLGGDENLLAFLDRLRDDESLAREVLEGGRSFVEQQGIVFPSEMRIMTSAATDRGIEIRGVFQDKAGRDYEVVWNSHDGFGVDHPMLRDKATLNPDVVYRAKRTQLSTDFTIIGTGFTSNGLVDLSIFIEPGRTVPSTSLGRVSADSSGHFQHFHRVWLLPGPDPQDRNPTFVGADVTVGKPGLEVVPSYYWYA